MGYSKFRPFWVGGDSWLRPFWRIAPLATLYYRIFCPFTRNTTARYPRKIAVGYVGQFHRHENKPRTEATKGCNAIPWGGGRRPVCNKGKTPDRFLTRSRGLQGAPFKAAVIREYLWDWFVDFRQSIKTTLSPKFVLSRARYFAKIVLAEQSKNRDFTPLPSLDKYWLLRWKRDYGVVFRRPNAR